MAHTKAPDHLIGGFCMGHVHMIVGVVHLPVYCRYKHYFFFWLFVTLLTRLSFPFGFFFPLRALLAPAALLLVSMSSSPNKEGWIGVLLSTSTVSATVRSFWAAFSSTTGLLCDRFGFALSLSAGGVGCSDLGVLRCPLCVVDSVATLALTASSLGVPLVFPPTFGVVPLETEAVLVALGSFFSTGEDAATFLTGDGVPFSVVALIALVALVVALSLIGSRGFPLVAGVAALGEDVTGLISLFVARPLPLAAGGANVSSPTKPGTLCTAFTATT